MSDASIRDSPRRPGVKQQGMEILMMHRGTRELLAAASFYEETRAKQDDINILETECSAGSSTNDDGCTSRRGRTVHEPTSKRIHTTRTQDAQNQSGSVHTQLGGRKQMRASGPSEQRSAEVLHEALPGHLAVPRMQHTLMAVGDKGVGDSTVGFVEHLEGKADGRAGACGEILGNGRGGLVQRLTG